MEKTRTEQQNKALHLYLTRLAKELNDAGYSVQLYLKQVVDIDFTKDLVKELIWRPIQKALCGKRSTTELDKVTEIDYIYDHIERHNGEKFGIHVPWPTKEEIAQLK